MSIGGSKQKSSGTQTSTGSSQSQAQDFGSEVWGQQSPFLQDLYNRAQGNLNAGDGDAGAMTNWARWQLVNANQSLGQSNQALQGFLNPTVDPAVNAYAQNLGQQFNEQFLPGLKGDAALAGGLGGSRQQIGSALGAQRAMQTLGDFAAQSYAGQQERALAAAQGLAANAAGYESLGNTTTAVADFSRSMPWYNLAQYQGLLGSPIQIDKGGIDQSWSKSESKGKNSGSGGSFNFGFGGG